MEQKYRDGGDNLGFRDVIGKTVFSQKEGINVGAIQDLMIEPNLLEVAAIVTSRGDVVKRLLYMIPSGEIKTWDQESIILVSQADVVRREEDLPECEDWFSVTGQMIGQDVVTTTGKKLGNLKDITIDNKGRITGLLISDVNQHTIQDADEVRVNLVPSVAIHSLGEVVSIVNPKNIAWITD